MITQVRRMNEATMLLKKQLPSVKKLLRRKTLEREVRASMRPRVDHSKSKDGPQQGQGWIPAGPRVDYSRAKGGFQQGQEWTTARPRVDHSRAKGESQQGQGRVTAGSWKSTV